MKTKKGFTLIELLITIAIIAVLSAIGLIAYTAVLKQGRDSKRQSDLRSIQSALEQYNSDQGFYPAPSPSPLTFGNPFNNCTGNPVTPCSATKTYMNAVPADPISSTPYSYVPSTSSYCLYAKLENLPSPAPVPLGCAYPTDYNFAVTPP